MDWKITFEERNKHDASFNNLNPINGYITGEKAREFFMKSNLPNNILGQIWGLADLNKDGKLDKKEFSIACCLIKKTLTNGQKILPATLPNSLLNDPVKTSPQTNTPPFNATFPSVKQQYTPTIMSPTGSSSQNQNISFPGNMNMNSPLVSSNQPPQRMPTSQSNLSSSSGNGMSMSMSSLVSTGVPTAFTVANNNLPNPIAPIPSTSLMKYSQMFQGNDPNSTGFISGQTAKTLLLQTGLNQAVLAQVWTLADYDKDGKLNFEEFINAMHLCDFSKAGNTLPATLPIELQPQRAKTATLPLTNNTLDIFNSPPMVPSNVSAAAAQEISFTAHTFEDKRKENFDRGNAVLEAKRQMLRDQEEREKREREEKERLEQEKKQRIREAQERQRQAEIERQIERQRIIDAQREEERKKIFEQREFARNELLRQQRIEWERQKKQELEVQKLKLQEQLSTLKAKDKNLEYDMQTLNEKISSYKNKINDTQMTLNELNNKLENTRKNYMIKQSEMEFKQTELFDYQQNLANFRQEKNFLNEKQNGYKDMETPFPNDFNDNTKELQAKQLTIQQLREEMENMEIQISTTRNQLNSVKGELEGSKVQETGYYMENDRLSKMLDMKRPNTMRHDSSFSQSMEIANASNNSGAAAFKNSFSSNNIRSETPKENYDAFKDEIFKIQQNVVPQNPINQSQDPFSNGSDPFGQNMPQNIQNSPQNNQQANFSNDWSHAFNKTNDSNGFGMNTDPFAIDPFNNNAQGPLVSNTADFENVWVQNREKSNGFQSAFMDTDLASSTTDNIFNGFNDADDNWASTASVLTQSNSNSDNLKTNSTPENLKKEKSFSAQSNPPTSNTNNTNNNDNWANFDNESSVKDTISMFNQSQESAPAPAPAVFPAANFNNQEKTIAMNPPNTAVKFRAEYIFEATREDELNLNIGDIIDVNLTVNTDEGWLYGEFQGRAGVFPAGFTTKLSDYEAALQQQGPQPVPNNFANNFPSQQSFNSQTGNTPMSPTGPGRGIPSSASFRSQKSFPVSSSFPNQAALNSNSNNTQLSSIKNYFISIYPYQSTEIGDLVFREFEIINVIDTNEDWLTGQIVGTGQGPANPLRAGIFPANFVIKFNFPIEYIGKHTIGMATEPYQAQNGGELGLNPAESQLIAIKKLSPDNKWSYGESYDLNNTLKKGWFPVQSALSLIDASVAPLYVPPPTKPTSPGSANVTPGNNENHNKSAQNSMSFAQNVNKSPSISSITSMTPPPPGSKSGLVSPTHSITTPTKEQISSKNHEKKTDISITNAQNNSSNSISSSIPLSKKVDSVEGLSSANSATALANSLASASTPNSNLSISASNQHSTPKSIQVVNEAPKTEPKMEPATTPNNDSKRNSISSIKTEQKSIVTTPVVEEPPSNPLPSRIIDQVIALYDFQSTTPETIGFPKDSVINIIEKSGDWWLGEYNGKMGLLPFNYVQSNGKINESST